MAELRRSETAERAKEIYERRIRPSVEKDHFGKSLSIKVDSGDDEVAADNADLTVFTLRVGYRTHGRIGGTRRRLAEGERL